MILVFRLVFWLRISGLAFGEHLPEIYPVVVMPNVTILKYADKVILWRRLLKSAIGNCSIQTTEAYATGNC